MVGVYSVRHDGRSVVRLDGWVDGWVGGVGCLSVIWAEQRAEAVVSVGRITVTVKLLPYCDKQTTTARATSTRMVSARKGGGGDYEQDEDERMGVKHGPGGSLGGWEWLFRVVVHAAQYSPSTARVLLHVGLVE